MHSVQIGRPQFEHVTAVSFDGWPVADHRLRLLGRGHRRHRSQRGYPVTSGRCASTSPLRPTRRPAFRPGIVVDVLRAHVHDRPGARRRLPRRLLLRRGRGGTGAQGRALSADAVLGGERGGDPPPGFDFGNSPSSTSLASGPARPSSRLHERNSAPWSARRANCDPVPVGSMLNLTPIAGCRRASGTRTWKSSRAGLRGGPRCRRRRPLRRPDRRALLGGEATEAAERAPRAGSVLRDCRGGVSGTVRRVGGDRRRGSTWSGAHARSVSAARPRFDGRKSGPAARLVAQAVRKRSTFPVDPEERAVGGVLDVPALQPRAVGSASISVLVARRR